MKMPPFLLFAALLFWGWQSDLLLIGALAGALLEAARFFKARWDLEDADFHRIWSFCMLVLIALGGYFITTSNASGGVGAFWRGVAGHQAADATALSPIMVLRWLPLIFFPFLLAQIYNVRPTVPLTAVSFALRWRRRRGEKTFTGSYLDVAYPYFMVCLFAAGVHTNLATQGFFWGQCVLILWVLWALRSPRFGFNAWAGAFVVVIALGFLGQLGISQAERMMQNFNAQWLAHFFRQRVDPTHSVTSIGQIGDLKLSARIVIRLEPKQLGMAPSYLREASYRNYHSQKETWYVGGAQNDFEDVPHVPNNETSWILVPGKTNFSVVTIACYLDGWSREMGMPEGLLPLPTGCGRLDNLPVYPLKLNKTGAALATGPGLVIFDADYGPGATDDSPPDTSTNRLDTTVPTNEIPALKQVIAEMKISGTNDADKRLAVERFFLRNFTYSTWQGPDKLSTNATPLARFLLNSRSGHCEYFATATVLLLRQLGIPARYAVGYAVHETSGSGYVVRERDAHAWCLAWNRQRQIWEDCDTTPGSWIAIESQHSKLLDSISDLRSWIGFQLAKLRWRQAHLRQYVLWTLLPVLAVLVYYILFQRRTKSRSHKKNSALEKPIIWPGHDSAFYRLEKKLAAGQVPRQSGEPLSIWLERSLAEPSLAGQRGKLQELLQLHYRYRFDPHGLNDGEKKLLVQDVEIVLETLAQK